MGKSLDYIWKTKKRRYIVSAILGLLAGVLGTIIKLIATGEWL